MVAYVLSELLAVSIKFFDPTARALGSTNFMDHGILMIFENKVVSAGRTGKTCMTKRHGFERAAGTTHTSFGS